MSLHRMRHDRGLTSHVLTGVVGIRQFLNKIHVYPYPNVTAVRSFKFTQNTKPPISWYWTSWYWTRRKQAEQNFPRLWG